MREVTGAENQIIAVHLLYFPVVVEFLVSRLIVFARDIQSAIDPMIKDMIIAMLTPLGPHKDTNQIVSGPTISSGIKLQIRLAHIFLKTIDKSVRYPINAVDTALTRAKYSKSV